MDGVAGTLYEGEHFQLLFKFNNKYPFDSPEVTFVGPNIPVHPHVYSNGHICLSILTEDWLVGHWPSNKFQNPKTFFKHVNL